MHRPGFVSIFALDVFSEQQSFWLIAWALLMHLMPSIFLAAVLALAWMREDVGGLVFISLSVAYLIIAANGAPAWYAGFILSGPAIVIGILFILNIKIKP